MSGRCRRTATPGDTGAGCSICPRARGRRRRRSDRPCRRGWPHRPTVPDRSTVAERGEVNAFQSFFASDSILWEGAWGSSSIRFRHNQDAGCPSAFPSYGKSQFQPLPTPVSPPDSHVKRTPFQGRKFHLTALATAGAAAFLILFVLLLTTSRSPNQAHAQSSANVDISLSDTSVDQGTAITATMSFSGLEATPTPPPPTTSSGLTCWTQTTEMLTAARAAVWGVDRNINQVDENPETRAGTIAAACPPGDYTLGVGISSAANEELASASVAFTIAAPASSPLKGRVQKAMTQSGRGGGGGCSHRGRVHD